MVKSLTRVFNISDPMPEPGDEFDNFGVAKIYGDAGSPHVQYMNMESARQFPIDRYPSVFEITTENVPGGFRAWEAAGSQTRLAMWSANNRAWGNVEMTFYIKVLTGSGTIVQPYIGGGHHHTSSNECAEGSAMKTRFYSNGRVAFRKEITHPAYCGDREIGNNWGGSSHGTAVWNGPIRNMVSNSIVGKWYGIKLIQILMSDRCRMEIWIDEGAGTTALSRAENEGRWRLLARYDDVVTGSSSGQPTSNWRSGTSICAPSPVNGNKTIPNGYVRLVPYAITHGQTSGHGFAVTNAAAGVIRTDGTVRYRLAYWSCREINPNNRLIAE